MILCRVEVATPSRLEVGRAIFIYEFLLKIMRGGVSEWMNNSVSDVW